MATSLMFWLVAGAAFAGPAGDRAAELKDEKAECDYVRSLCEDCRRRDDEFNRAKRDVERDATVENVDRYRDSFALSYTAFAELMDAVKVIVRKHNGAPTCFRDCADLINGHLVDGLP